jgi:hypothetical protein
MGIGAKMPVFTAITGAFVPLLLGAGLAGPYILSLQNE